MAIAQIRWSCRAARGVGDSTLCLDSFGPLEIKEKTLFARSDFGPRGVSGWVKRLSSGWRKVGDPEVAQETETNATLSGTRDGSVSHTATSLMRSSLETADLWSG